MELPPSTSRADPVTKLEASEARNKAARAMHTQDPGIIEPDIQATISGQRCLHQGNGVALRPTAGPCDDRDLPVKLHGSVPSDKTFLTVKHPKGEHHPFLAMVLEFNNKKRSFRRLPLA